MRDALAALMRATRSGPTLSPTERATYNALHAKLDAATTPDDQAYWQTQLNSLPPRVLQVTGQEERQRYLEAINPTGTG